MRKLLSVLSSTLQGGLRGGLLLLALLATTSLWAYDFQLGDLYYNITSNSEPYTVEVSGLESYINIVTIPETVTYNGTTYSVTSIGYAAFYECSSLTSITIPNSVTSIGGYAFCDCSSLTSITIPNSVTSIGESVFLKCSSLTSITIPNSVTSIGELAFEGCSSLTSIAIPNSVTSIGNGAFAGCSGLKSMVVESGNTVYDSRGNCNAIIETATNTLIAGCQNTIIPNSVTSIGEWAFLECESLTSITIPNSVTSIGSSAFAYCSSLTSITIPNSVTSIGDDAFIGCTSLTSITIPNSVTSIGDYAFAGCSGLKSMVVECGNTVYDSRGNCNAIIESATNTLIAGCQNTIIPNSVTSIGISAFYDCSSLTSITIPNSVTSIENYAFNYCSSLTTVICEAVEVPELGWSVFGNTPLSEATLYVPCGSEDAYKVADGWKEFYKIQGSLAEYSIQVSTSNSQMGSAIVNYNNCTGNQISATANYGYHFVQWSDGVTDNPRTIVLTQDTVLTAEFAQTFSGQCGDNLYWSYDETTKTISITGSGNMYDYTADTQPWLLFKEEIKEVTVSNTATSIGTSAFEGCIRLGKVSIGSAMVNVGANAFAGCTRLYDVYCYATYPPFADESSFANYNVYVYIPCEYQRDYILDVVWGKFKFIECIESEETTTDDVVVTPGTNDVTITWPTEGNADTYTIVIKKGAEVFCTLTFNAEGQLLNIAFAPGRDGNHPAQYAEQAANGYRFTVTGLEAGTHYAYNIDVRDAANKTIKSHAGEFTTESLTAVENTHSQSPKTNYQKILRNGQLLILRDGVEYTVMGQEL